MFSTVYRVTQKEFYARPYTSMWAPVVVRQISKRYSRCYKLNCKDVVYRRKVRDLADLRQRNIEAVELITPHILINTWQVLEYRLDICRATTGAHIEVYGRA